MSKIFVSKEQYNQVKNAEKALGVKIARAPKGWEFRVPDCVNGQYGIYKVNRCYPSGLKYIADVELVEATKSHQETLIRMAALQRESAEAGKLKIIVTD